MLQLSYLHIFKQPPDFPGSALLKGFKMQTVNQYLVSVPVQIAKTTVTSNWTDHSLQPEHIHVKQDIVFKMQIIPENIEFVLYQT